MLDVLVWADVHVAANVSLLVFVYGRIFDHMQW